MTVELKYDIARSEVVPFVPSSARVILDVGCGSGRLGAELRQARPSREMWAVEPDPASAQAAREVFDHVIEGTLDTALPDLPPRHFDVVTYTDVLEHMVDPADALLATRSLLADGGVVVASIPNIRHFSAVWPLIRRDSWRYEDTGLLDRTHLRFFTRTSMLELFTAAGYTVRSIDGINATLDWRTPGGRRARWISKATAGRADPFLFVQYVIVASP